MKRLIRNFCIEVACGFLAALGIVVVLERLL
ncbi:hypothetical protein FHY31_000979 [Xanthomonas euvesicatoria]|uniref:TRAP transporter small permease n=1 Tax=Xanthomonas euvesicatoria TaxID=456327 RepID=A0AAW3U0T8_XANEU|nr:hypothetical protein [Xanthomonas euvesicatoria]MBB4869254.1 hypothetical protein [Xanthomonas euvesicatoria]